LSGKPHTLFRSEALALFPLSRNQHQTLFMPHF
jgi:hypothetical protein